MNERANEGNARKNKRYHYANNFSDYSNSGGGGGGGSNSREVFTAMRRNERYLQRATQRQ